MPTDEMNNKFILDYFNKLKDPDLAAQATEYLYSFPLAEKVSLEIRRLESLTFSNLEDLANNQIAIDSWKLYGTRNFAVEKFGQVSLVEKERGFFLSRFYQSTITGFNVTLKSTLAEKLLEIRLLSCSKEDKVKLLKQLFEALNQLSYLLIDLKKYEGYSRVSILSFLFTLIEDLIHELKRFDSVVLPKYDFDKLKEYLEQDEEVKLLDIEIGTPDFLAAIKIPEMKGESYFLLTSGLVETGIPNLDSDGFVRFKTKLFESFKATFRNKTYENFPVETIFSEKELIKIHKLYSSLNQTNYSKVLIEPVITNYPEGAKTKALMAMFTTYMELYKHVKRPQFIESFSLNLLDKDGTAFPIETLNSCLRADK